MGLLDQIRDRLHSIGDEDQAFSAVMDTRGENPGGMPHPALADLGVPELALADRYASGEQANKELGTIGALAGGVFGIAPYEAIKGISQNVPGASGLLSAAGRLTGDPKAESNYAMNASTSPASIQNVFAYLRGALGRPKPKPKHPLLSSFSAD